MHNPPLPQEKINPGEYKERPFLDICEISHTYLMEKSSNNFISRPYAYKLLCGRFSMKKEVIKALLKRMQERGMIRNMSRGVLLL